ncbi:phytoene desaturase family protein [Butyrivibrio proteoclasticus]|uniref:phytoene desaturase family protein n=1 Tax=Butyrivibrio proteoclasticus TaxID=43305 RepID=UPI00047D8ECC|nr:NAD(P)/FAD-dependent oxidoreductase [Butyrivibrio proteoclasticus]
MEKSKVVVIGGGIAGLSAGIYALKAGFDVDIYEKNAIPGGECIGWNRKGFHIDNCIHWLTGTKKGTELYDVWESVGALAEDTEYADISSFYTSTYKGQSVTLWNDLERTRKELVEISPEDEAEINKFIQYVEYSKQCLIPAAKPMEMWGIGDYIKMGKSMADFPKVMKEFGKISLEDYSKRFKSPLLQKMLCDYLPKEYCVYSFMVSYATMADGNGKVPMGASLQMSLRMEKKFKELGGKIFYNAPVNSIVVGDNGMSAKAGVVGKKNASGIELGDGSFVAADYVIPTIDTNFLFDKLLPSKYMPKELKKAYENQKAYPATSGFQVAFAAPCNFEAGETTFVDIEPLTVGDRSFDRMYVKAYGYDAVCVNGDRQVIQTSIFQTDEDYFYWKGLSSEEYNRVKEEKARQIQDRIEAAYPELKGCLEYLDAWTPLTYERYCNAYHGSYMSFVTTPLGKSVRITGRLKGLKNVYLAGQWTSAPGGLPVAVTSGKFAVQRILKDLKRDVEI